MRGWVALACLALAAGCTTPQISMTDATRQHVTFLVRNPLMTPRQAVFQQAAGYCRQLGRSYQPTKTISINTNLTEMSFDCVEAEAPSSRSAEMRRKPPRPARVAAEKPPRSDVKAAAWAQAKTAADAWALCLRFGAERKAKESADVAPLVAISVVGACVDLERAVHAPLQAIGEDSNRFQADMHEQALQSAADTITDVRTRARASVSGAAAVPAEP